MFSCVLYVIENHAVRILNTVNMCPIVVNNQEKRPWVYINTVLRTQLAHRCTAAVLPHHKPFNKEPQLSQHIHFHLFPTLMLHYNNPVMPSPPQVPLLALLPPTSCKCNLSLVYHKLWLLLLINWKLGTLPYTFTKSHDVKQRHSVNMLSSHTT